MSGETPAPFVLCPPACAEAVRAALPPGCDLVVAGSPEEARAAFAARSGAPAADGGGAGEVTLDGRTFDLTTLERAVFDVLSGNPGRSLSRAELLRRIHGAAAGSVLPRVVDSTVSRLRRKLGPSGWRVQTVWGRGYRWNAGERPPASSFATALRWSAGTLGVVLVAALLVARPPAGEAPAGAPGGAPVGDLGDAGDLEEFEDLEDPGDGGNIVWGGAFYDVEPAVSLVEARGGDKFDRSEAVVRQIGGYDGGVAVRGRMMAASAPLPISVATVPAAPAEPVAAAALAPPALSEEAGWIVLPPDPFESLPPKEGFAVHEMTEEDKTLSNLARTLGVPLAEIVAANPQIADPDRVRVGQPVYVPVASPTRAKRIAP